MSSDTPPTQPTMRQRLQEIIARQDAERGRPLTAREQLENLAAALAEDDGPCPLCGVSDNEPCPFEQAGNSCALEWQAAPT